MKGTLFVLLWSTDLSSALSSFSSFTCQWLLVSSLDALEMEETGSRKDACH